LTESAGKEDPATQPPPPQAARGGRWGHGGGTYPRPKDSHYVGGVLMPFARWRHGSLQAGAVKISIGRIAKILTLGPPQPLLGGR